LLLAVLVFATVVRLHGLTRDSLWFDEALTATLIQAKWSQIIKAIISAEQTPPFYFLLMKVWTGLVGISDWTLRFPSVVFGVVTIWQTYRLAAYCAGKTEGIIAAALMSASRYHIWYSQEARTYTLMLMLALWSCDEFVHMLKEPRRVGREARYWLATTLLLYSHLYGVFVIAAQVVHWCIHRLIDRNLQLRLSMFVQLMLAVALAFSPWIKPVWYWLNNVAPSFWMSKTSIHDIADTYFLFTGAAVIWPLLVLVALVVIGCARRDTARWLPLWLTLLLAPVVVPVMISVLKRPMFLHRYAFISIAPLFILAACGIARFPRVLQVCLTMPLMALMLIGPDIQPKPDWRDAGAYIDAHALRGDYVLSNPGGTLLPVNYYVHRRDITRRSYWTIRLPLGLPLMDPSRHIWQIVNEPLPPGSGVATIQVGHFRVASQRKFGAVTVYELADGATDAKYAYPDEIRFNAKPVTSDRTPIEPIPPKPVIKEDKDMVEQP
jgi:hypothetical protein